VDEFLALPAGAEKGSAFLDLNANPERAAFSAFARFQAGSSPAETGFSPANGPTPAKRATTDHKENSAGGTIQ
jgi:hypothetical protein